MQNNRFGWRFLGPKSRGSPRPISIPRSKPRIPFAFSSSANPPLMAIHNLFSAAADVAGDVALRHPGVRFEVVNAAMTAINSYAILPIARDCGKADGDVWVIYMGNNEVVGPFGPGTVFGPQVPPLPLIRGILALKTTRTGQLLDRDASGSGSHRRGVTNGGA